MVTLHPRQRPLKGRASGCPPSEAARANPGSLRRLRCTCPRRGKAGQLRRSHNTSPCSPAAARPPPRVQSQECGRLLACRSRGHHLCDVRRPRALFSAEPPDRHPQLLPDRDDSNGLRRRMRVVTAVVGRPQQAFGAVQASGRSPALPAHAAAACLTSGGCTSPSSAPASTPHHSRTPVCLRITGLHRQTPFCKPQLSHWNTACKEKWITDRVQ